MSIFTKINKGTSDFPTRTARILIFSCTKKHILCQFGESFNFWNITIFMENTFFLKGCFFKFEEKLPKRHIFTQMKITLSIYTIKLIIKWKTILYSFVWHKNNHNWVKYSKTRGSKPFLPSHAQIWGEIKGHWPLTSWTTIGAR